ncbi:DUF4347 domain-containing protein [uncultured Albimonas sp.]|uniref:DUF4347 domain-containing protein n=1 Tax=uncultured Albimonas sp. TaxID=1331701 RepID=UPI0030EB9823|tara:strand:- start:3802 stop:8793 length:4992 start_codon:yes stop_codon:yes gene_type:complete
MTPISLRCGHLRAAAPSLLGGRIEVAVIDVSVAGWERLAQALHPGVGIVTLPRTGDGLAHLAAWTEGRRGIDALHLIAHGAPGEIRLGALTLDLAAVASRGVELARIGAALAPEAELLVWSCETGADGGVLLAALARATGASVAGSDDVTGQDGDWDLEVSTGPIRTPAPFDLVAAQAWGGRLALPSASQSFGGAYLAGNSNGSTVDGFTVTTSTGGAIVQQADSLFGYPASGSTVSVTWTADGDDLISFDLDSFTVSTVEDSFDIVFSAVSNGVGVVQNASIATNYAGTLVIDIDETVFNDITSFTVTYTDTFSVFIQDLRMHGMALADLVGAPLDATPPAFDAAPAATAHTPTSATVSVDVDEAATVYWVMVADGAAAPSALQVSNGQDAAGAAAGVSGSQTLASAPFDTSLNLSGLTPGTDYDLYVVAADVAGNLMAAPARVDIHAPGELVSLSVAPGSQTEGSDATVTATLDQVSPLDVTVTLTAGAAGTATGADYTISATTIVIPAGQLSAGVTVSALADGIDEADETLSIDIASVANATEDGDQRATLTLVDGDPAPGVSLATSTATLIEGGPGLTVTATIDALSGQDVTVVLEVTGASEDVHLTAATIVIPAGSLSGATTLNAVNDTMDEATETATLAIASVTNGTETGVQSIDIDVVDNDPTPALTLSVDQASLAESGGVGTLTATLDAVSGRDVTAVLLIGGDATPGVDYTLSSTSITIPAGSLTGTVTLSVIDDAIDEFDQVVTIDVDSVANASDDGHQQTGFTIVDDEDEPVATLSVDPASVDEAGGVATLTVTLSGASEKAPTVELDSASGTATLDVDYQLSGTALTFQAGETSKTLTLTGLDDIALEDAAETATLTFAGTRVSLASNTIAVGVVDDEVPPEALSILRADGAAEAANVATVTFEARFDQAVTGVDATDFALTGAAAVGASILSVTDAGAGDVWRVAVDVTGLEGALGLNLLNDGSIQAGPGAYLDAARIGDQTFLLDRSGPTASIGVVAGDDVIDAAETAAGLTVGGAATDATGIATLTATLGGATVAGAVSGGQWSAGFSALDLAGLADGAATLSVTLTDTLGTATTLTRALTLDRTGPVATLAEADGFSVSIQLDEDVVPGGPAGFSVVADGQAIPVLAVSGGSGGPLLLTLAAPVAEGEAVSVGWDPEAAGASLIDLAGNAAGAIALSATNATTGSAAETIDGLQVTTVALGSGPDAIEVITAPIVTDTRVDSSGNVGRAGIPVAYDETGAPVLRAQLPEGFGIQSVGPRLAGPASGAGGALQQSIGAGASESERAELETLGARWLSSLPGSTPLTVRTLTPTIATAAPIEPMAIAGGFGGGMTAVTLDLRTTGGANLILRDIEFVAVSGAATLTGGRGEQFVTADSAIQHIVLGAGDDRLYGGGGDDTVGSRGGDDRVFGGEGDDIVFGGAGADVVRGGAGRDAATGEAGDDLVVGGAGHDNLGGGWGDDLLLGGRGADAMRGSGGDDRLEGGEGGDKLAGGRGDDHALGGEGADVLRGKSGADALRGNAGDDRLAGGEGDDALQGGRGSDRLSGGEGADMLDGGLGSDRLIGGEGPDVFRFEAASGRDVIVDFIAGLDRIEVAADIGGLDLDTGADLLALASQAPRGVLVDLGDAGEILLRGLELSELSASDFGLV